MDDKSIVSNAVKVIENKVEGKNVASHLSVPTYSLKLTSNSAINSNKNDIAEKIIDLSDNIVSGIKATVGEETYIFKKNDDTDVVESFLQKYSVDDSYCNSEFIGTVSIEDGLFLSADVNNRVGINAVLDSVPVQTVANVVTEKQTDYKTVTVPTSDLLKGVEQVKCDGENGIIEIVEQVTYLNGAEVERTVLSQSVVSEPVDKVILIGTSVSEQEAENNAAAHNIGFIFPLAGSYKLGDSFGDGRQHKGYDILANKGTSIVAVKGGTVIRSGWYSGYGNCVEIDHGDGIITRYGHASELLCTVGQKVTAGSIIARVGSTGNSTGNHLHFEVIKNGNRVNPAPYIGIE